MLASGNNSNCMLCDIYTVKSVEKSAKEFGIRTAIKINSSGSVCPTDLGKSVFTGQHSENNTYTVTFSGEIGTIEYTKKCIDPSWRMFPRFFGPFCIVVANNTTPLSRNTASTACKSRFGIGLTALNSIAERNYVIESERIAMGTHSKYKYSSIWVNGGLRSDCDFVGSEKTAECAGMKAYQYLGDLINSFEAYQFGSGYPNYAKIGGSSQACLQLMVSQSETKDNGLVKNAVCGTNCNEDDSICALTFVCGY